MNLRRRGVKTEILRILAGQVTILAAMADASFFSIPCLFELVKHFSRHSLKSMTTLVFDEQVLDASQICKIWGRSYGLLQTGGAENERAGSQQQGL
ncbi:hypothetical protein Tco_0052423 [Tanacetum coccineum]